MKNLKWLFTICFLILLLVGCKKKTYTIILNYNGLSGEVEQIEIVDGSAFPRFPKPSSEFNSFDGWYATKNGSEFKVTDGNYFLLDNGKFYSKNYDSINNTIEFVAKYKSNEINCYIELDYNNNSISNKTLSIKYGNKIQNLSNVSKEYSKFLGWYTMYNGSEVMIHNGTDFMYGCDILDENHYNISNYTTKIYAKYLEDDISIILDADSDEFNNQTIVSKYDSILNSLPMPEKDNYVFEYWYYDNGGKEVIVFNKNGFVNNMNLLNTSNYKINNKEIILKAKYSVENKSVILKLGNSENASTMTIKVPYGENITEYVNHIRIDGKVVSKWSTKINDVKFENTFIGPVVEDNIVLYPAENKYYLLRLIGNTTEEKLVEENSYVNLDTLSKTDYIFIGWKDESNKIYKNTYKVTSETTLEATYLFAGKKTFNVRQSGFSSPYIYTPKSVDKKPKLREWEDLVNFKGVYDINALKENGYTGFIISYSCDVKVIDDGYQHFYIYNNREISDNYLLYSKKCDYSEGNTTVSFTTTITFDKLSNEYISIRYAASGYFNELLYSHGNQWNCSNVVVTLTPCK